MQLEAPASEYEPAAQLTHVATEIALIADEEVPAAHAVQLEAPAGENEPGAQLTHVETDVAPSVDDEEPAAHAVQLDAFADEKVPFAQAIQEGATPPAHDQTPVLLLRLRLVAEPAEPATQLKA